MSYTYFDNQKNLAITLDRYQTRKLIFEHQLHQAEIIEPQIRGNLELDLSWLPFNIPVLIYGLPGIEQRLEGEYLYDCKNHKDSEYKNKPYNRIKITSDFILPHKDYEEYGDIPVPSYLNDFNFQGYHKSMVLRYHQDKKILSIDNQWLYSILETFFTELHLAQQELIVNKKGIAKAKGILSDIYIEDGFQHQTEYRIHNQYVYHNLNLFFIKPQEENGHLYYQNEIPSLYKELLEYNECYLSFTYPFSYELRQLMATYGDIKNIDPEIFNYYLGLNKSYFIEKIQNKIGLENKLAIWNLSLDFNNQYWYRNFINFTVAETLIPLMLNLETSVENESQQRYLDSKKEIEKEYVLLLSQELADIYKNPALYDGWLLVRNLFYTVFIASIKSYLNIPGYPGNNILVSAINNRIGFNLVDVVQENKTNSYRDFEDKSIFSSEDVDWELKIEFEKLENIINTSPRKYFDFNDIISRIKENLTSWWVELRFLDKLNFIHTLTSIIKERHKEGLDKYTLREIHLLNRKSEHLKKALKYELDLEQEEIAILSEQLDMLTNTEIPEGDKSKVKTQIMAKYKELLYETSPDIIEIDSIFQYSHLELKKNV